MAEIITTQTKRPRQDEEYHQNSHQDSSTSNPNNYHAIPRDEDQHESVAKRHKSYDNILDILDDDDDDEQEVHEHQQSSDQDLSAIFTTLQRELASSSSSDHDDNQQPPPCNTTATTTEFAYLSHELDDHYVATNNDGGSIATSADEEDENAKSVMRHLLEASDDELGIPSNNYDAHNEENQILNNISNNDDDQGFENVAPFGNFNDDHGVFWEFEDEAANYYSMMQSELFM